MYKKSRDRIQARASRSANGGVSGVREGNRRAAKREDKKKRTNLGVTHTCNREDSVSDTLLNEIQV